MWHSKPYNKSNSMDGSTSYTCVRKHFLFHLSPSTLGWNPSYVLYGPQPRAPPQHGTRCLITMELALNAAWFFFSFILWTQICSSWGVLCSPGRLQGSLGSVHDPRSRTLAGRPAWCWLSPSSHRPQGVPASLTRSTRSIVSSHGKVKW